MTVIMFLLSVIILIPLCCVAFFIIIAFIPAAFLGNITFAYIIMFLGSGAVAMSAMASGSLWMGAFALFLLFITGFVLFSQDGQAIAIATFQDIRTWF